LTSLSFVEQTLHRYVQQHAVAMDIRSYPASKYDGMTELWFDEIDSFGRCLSDAEYMRVARLDELKLHDLAETDTLSFNEDVVVAYGRINHDSC
jgi:hypothetical protein